LPITPYVDKLTEKRHITVILRLVVNQDGRLVHGEVVDVEGKPQGRFVGWQQLGPAIQGWMAKQATKLRSPEEGGYPIMTSQSQASQEHGAERMLEITGGLSWIEFY
jgi:hypothetical protein